MAARMPPDGDGAGGAALMEATLGLALVAFALGAGFGPLWLQLLRAQGVGKQLNPSEINPANPAEHAGKEGTPTMGGMVFLAPILATGLTFDVLFRGRLLLLVPLALAAGCAVLGAADDMQTLVGRARSAGLSPRTKWAAQIVMSLAGGGLLAYAGVTQVHVPFVGVYVLPPWLYTLFAALVLVATINAVAITDGMDSLLGTTAAIAFAAFWIVGLLLGYPLTATLCAICVGALLAYLWFNAYPAQLWMGDTGSLALGALLGMAALLEREPFLLLPIGIIFVAEAASDILQVASNKLTGKRLFRLAPVHHHFRRGGWPETWVVQRFWIVGALGALIGLLVAVKG